jgi:hypothetical protein
LPVWAQNFSGKIFGNGVISFFNCRRKKAMV